VNVLEGSSESHEEEAEEGLEEDGSDRFKIVVKRGREFAPKSVEWFKRHVAPALLYLPERLFQAIDAVSSQSIGLGPWD